MFVSRAVLDDAVRLREDAAVHDDVGARRQVGQDGDGAADVEVGVRGGKGRGPHGPRERDDLAGLERRGFQRERGLPERVRAVGHEDVGLGRAGDGGDDGVPVAVRELQRILAADLLECHAVGALDVAQEALEHRRRADEVARQRTVGLVDAPARRDAQDLQRRRHRAGRRVQADRARLREPRGAARIRARTRVRARARARLELGMRCSVASTWLGSGSGLGLARLREPTYPHPSPSPRAQPRPVPKFSACP